MEKHLIQNTDEWLSMRRNFIGASDSITIMGLSPWKKMYQLWEEKLGIGELQSSNQYTVRGHELEPVARKKYCEIVGVDVSPEVLFHEKYDWMMASLDGVSQNKTFAVEIKCPGKADHDIAKEGKIPDKYYPQLQHQLEVLQLSTMHYFSYVNNDDYVLLTVHRNEKYIEKLLKAEKEFWDRVKNFDPPEKEYKEMESPEWAAISNEWIEVSRSLKQLQDREKTLRDELIKLSGDKSCVGNGVKTHVFERKGSVDYSKIDVLKNIDLDQYRKPISKSWRITLTDEQNNPNDNNNF